MPISLGPNIAALRAVNKLKIHTNNVNTSMERLASGRRINSASDDPAGLALEKALRNDANLFGVAKRNANDGISLLNVTDEALSEISNIIRRLREIAEQGSNSTYTFTQRSVLEIEAIALSSEIQRISETTKFNGIKLLSASSSINIQVGIDSTNNSVINLNAVFGTLESLFLADTGSKTLNQTVLGSTENEAVLNSLTFLEQTQIALDELSVRRGELGASTSRLESSVNSLSAKRESFINSINQITDVDVAKEVANLVASQILQQASQAVLAQANLQPQIALDLLS